MKKIVAMAVLMRFTINGSEDIVRFLTIPNEKAQINEAISSQTIKSPFSMSESTVIFEAYEAQKQSTMDHPASRRCRAFAQDNDCFVCVDSAQ
jgi:hypothetical protein